MPNHLNDEQLMHLEGLAAELGDGLPVVVHLAAAVPDLLHTIAMDRADEARRIETIPGFEDGLPEFPSINANEAREV